MTGSSFWKRVRFTEGCWIWEGPLDKAGYGRCPTKFLHGQRVQLAHRMAYLLATGTLPTLGLDHLCRVRACVNPLHLEPVTQKENTLRGNTVAARHAAATECPSGHPYDEDNTYRYPDGRRDCKECIRRRKREYRARKKASV